MMPQLFTQGELWLVYAHDPECEDGWMDCNGTEMEA